MKNFAKIFIGILLAGNFIACTSQSGKAPKLSSNMDTVSYAIGVWIASGPANVPDKSEIDLGLVKKAMADVFAGNDSVFDKQKLQTILQKFSMDQQAKQAELDKKDEEVRIKEGEDFLAKNKAKPGVVVTPSGLQYRVIKEGSGRQPLDTNVVKVNYKGALLNGKVFDSSYERGEPAQFQLNRVIKGWTEGLQLMKEGSVYEFVIPAELAYGNRAMGEDIKPFSTLIFEVELLEVVTPGIGLGK
jgi:FKBP-type peptidyl-prolyl cis-trans isomerase FklB